jgi:ornithine carbamoyltransferase
MSHQLTRDSLARAERIAHDLVGRSFLKEQDFTVLEWSYLLDLAQRLKLEHVIGMKRARLQGANLALVLEQASTSTRCAFEVAAHHQGAQQTYLDPTGSQLGHKESIRDTARVLGRMYDGIEYRGFAQSAVEQLAEASGIPVWNGLTNEWHPTQSLCDVLTLTEHRQHADRISFAYLGDARNNVAHSLLIAGAMMGMDVRMVAPKELWTGPEVLESAAHLAETTGGSIVQTDAVAEGVDGVDFLYTDVWLSMGEPAELWDERIDLLSGYAVSMDTLRASHNPDVKFMHCLPAFHNRETAIGQEIFTRTGRSYLEVDDEVSESSHSIVFDQAENRLHTIKAVMVATAGLLPCA